MMASPLSYSSWLDVAKTGVAAIGFGFSFGCTVTLGIHLIQKTRPKNLEPSNRKTMAQRYGSAIRLKPGTEEKYVVLHAAVWPKVLARIHASNIRNYTIYHFESLGLLFSHFEYVGDDFEADMARIAQDEVTIKWWKECEPCQEPLEWRGPPPSQGGKGNWWAPGKEVFHCGHPPAGYL